MSTLCAGGWINAMVLKTGSFAELQMDLEAVTQSEVSQKEKNKYHILRHIYLNIHCNNSYNSHSMEAT